MTYDELLVMSDAAGLIAREKDLLAYDGRIKGRRVAIRRSIPTNRRKACVLAEELGHYYTSVGNILGDNPDARKQERRARLWAYNIQIGLSGLIRAKEAGCRTLYETAECLDVPVGFLRDCLECYRGIYGDAVRYRGHVIIFDPYLDVLTTDDLRRENDW